MTEIQELRYGVIGNHLVEVEKIMSSYPKAKLLQQSLDKSSYERFTLHRLLEDCQKMTEPAHILYLHSKGISHPMELYESKIKGWTELMLTGLCTYRYLCWKELSRGADTVGSLYLDLKDGKNSPHFSGNFWWATSTHIATLKPIGKRYHDPEMWIIGTIKNVRFVKIDQILEPPPVAYNPYLANFSFPSLQEYRGVIVFTPNLPFPLYSLPHSEINHIKIGLYNSWVPCCIPSPGTLKLTLDVLRIQTDPHVNSVKIIIVTMKSGKEHYFKEGENVHIY